MKLSQRFLSVQTKDDNSYAIAISYENIANGRVCFIELLGSWETEKEALIRIDTCKEILKELDKEDKTWHQLVSNCYFPVILTYCLLDGLIKYKLLVKKDDYYVAVWRLSDE